MDKSPVSSPPRVIHSAISEPQIWRSFSRMTTGCSQLSHSIWEYVGTGSHFPTISCCAAPSIIQHYFPEIRSSFRKAALCRELLEPRGLVTVELSTVVTPTTSVHALASPGIYLTIKR